MGTNPIAIEYNPRNGDIYVTNLSSNDVSIIGESTNTVIDTLRVGVHPSSLEYNPSNGEIYVANEMSGDVTVIFTNTSTDRIPSANAGPDKTVDSREVVQLDGSNSSDPNGSALTYQWTQTSGPEVTLSDSTSASSSFTAAETNVQTDLTFQLVVTNEEGMESEPDSVTIDINPSNSPSAPPPFEGIVGSGNNVNIQIQENSGHNSGGQSGDANLYSDSPIFQGQSTEQDSKVVS